MGLAERRAVARFRDEEFPQWQQRIQEAAGFEVPLDVDWDTFAQQGTANYLGQSLGPVYFEPLTGALAGITIDDLGREALRDGLTRIVVTNSDRFDGYEGSTFVDGLLTIDARPAVNVSEVSTRRKGLQSLLENAL